MSNYITTDWLNLRRDPSIPADKNSNVIGVLPPESVVEQLPDLNTNHWFHVRTFLGNKEAKGFTSTNFLKETQNVLPVIEPAQTGIIPEAHLIPGTGKIIRRNEINGRAFPLNEPGVKRFQIAHSANKAQNIKEIHEVLGWLDVEHSQRYAPTNSNTYCNIYAYDVAYCCGVYIPRVWWNEKAFQQIKNGLKPQPVYEKMVTELNANALTDWFENYGESFHWKRVLDIDILQKEVNTGMLGFIVAQRINLNRSGHIVAIIPETSDHHAQRDANNNIISPLQSQAGVVNKQLFTANNWWVNPNKFRKFGLWVIQPQ
jgi:hypothetical protein